MTAKRVVVAGATGLVGRHLVAALANRTDIDQVIALVRNKPEWADDRSVEGVDWQEIDFAKITDATAEVQADVALCTLGTTQNKAGSKEAFAKVDRDYVVAFAEGALRGGADHFCMVSSVGASASSPSFYLKTKGQAEKTVESLGFERIDIFRPGLLTGARQEFRLGEEVGKFLMPVMTPIMSGPLARYRSIDAFNVAKAMAQTAATSSEPGTYAHYSRDMEDAASAA